MRPNSPTIPREVLDKIVQHRPHLATIVGNIPAAPSQCEKALADAYLAGETRLTVQETWKLAACSAGNSYGGHGDE
jgi:putative cell wall-binding protein